MSGTVSLHRTASALGLRPRGSSPNRPAGSLAVGDRGRPHGEIGRVNTDLGDVDRVSIGLATDADVEGLFQIYLDVVTSGGAEPRTDAPLREVFAEGWIQQRRVYAARCGGVTVGGYFLRTNFPAFAAHIAQGGYLVARAARRQGLGR